MIDKNLIEEAKRVMSRMTTEMKEYAYVYSMFDELIEAKVISGGKHEITPLGTEIGRQLVESGFKMSDQRILEVGTAIWITNNAESENDEPTTTR